VLAYRWILVPLPARQKAIQLHSLLHHVCIAGGSIPRIARIDGFIPNKVLFRKMQELMLVSCPLKGATPCVVLRILRISRLPFDPGYKNPRLK